MFEESSNIEIGLEISLAWNIITTAQVTETGMQAL